MKAIMTVFAVVVTMFSSCLCCHAAEVALTSEQVEVVEDILYDTTYDFMRARAEMRGMKKHGLRGVATRNAARYAYKHAELSGAYELCDVAGVKYHEHENVREYGRLLTVYFLRNVESAKDLTEMDPKKMFPILKGPAAELAAIQAGQKVFLEAASMQEGMKTIRAELVAKYGEAGLQKRLKDIVRLHREIAKFVLED